MASASRIPLSGSTHGAPILIAAVATVGNTVHQGNNSATEAPDEIWLWAWNRSTSAILLTLEWSIATAATNNPSVTIPPGAQVGAVALAPGWPLRNNLLVTAFAATANQVLILGYANRIVN